MKIKIFQLLEGAKQATGLTVIIDVFRAFSTACYAVGCGAGPLFPVATVEEAFALKEKIPQALLVGERNERPPQGFDFGNSPTHITKSDIAGRAIIHTTSSGTQGIAHAKNAVEVITGSFVNAGAIVRYIKRQNPDMVSLVCMGYACLYPTDEDTLCAQYIKNELVGVKNDWGSMIKQIREGSGKRFFETESQEWAPSSDFGLCLDKNRFDFILKVYNHDGLQCLHETKI
ncbi:MAG: 2-phosphosulfolactate phosphatase [Prolixibacteraceae bacterium]|nr:2-phosphosulfolactate phosphatase [Prolixibacteraceae bacterium]